MSKEEKQNTLSINQNINPSQFVDKFLAELIYEETRRKLLIKIDNSLVTRNEKEFYILSDQYNNLINSKI
ncbi:MAG: hypothetical protein K0S34_2301 [Bacillales bacterium]|jgi:uncharacterized protein YpiB (UPF0302 family)|nr:hypothetical protein [Bacillales bacterium]